MNSHGAVVAYINPGVHGQPWTRRVLSSITPGAVNLTVADVNGDGKPDVIVAMRSNSGSGGAQTVGIAWLENTGSPTGEGIYHTIDTTPGNFGDPRTLQAGDIAQDGKTAVVVSDAETGVLAWYSQISPDHWQRHVISAGGLRWVRLPGHRFQHRVPAKFRDALEERARELARSPRLLEVWSRERWRAA